MLKIVTIFGVHDKPLKVTPIIMQNLEFSDYVMKMTVKAPVYFSIVLSLKSNESN